VYAQVKRTWRGGGGKTGYAAGTVDWGAAQGDRHVGEGGGTGLGVAERGGGAAGQSSRRRRIGGETVWEGAAGRPRNR
ncbi:hypothetical protein KI387_017438, partial [Taxus chinensis]